MFKVPDAGINTYSRLKIDAHSPRNSANICIYLMCLGTKIISLYFAADSMGLSVFSE